MAFPRNGANAEGRPRLYSCKYCDKAFASPQALGGHQNGHRKERDVLNRVHQDPNHFFAFQNPPPPPPLSNILSHDPLLNFDQGHNFFRSSSNLSHDFNYYQTYHHHQPYQFNGINQETNRVDAGSSSRKYLLGSKFGNGGGSVSRNEAYWRLPNFAGLEDDKENEIDLTLHL